MTTSAREPSSDSAPLVENDSAPFVCRLDEDPEAAAAGRVEAVARQLDRDARAGAVDEREERFLDEVEGRRVDVVRAAFEREEARGPRDHQRRQHRLQDERGAAGRADPEGVVAGRDLARLERELARADRRALDARATHLGRRQHGRQMLPLQAGPLATRPHALDAEGLAGDERERERRAYDLTAALAE